MASSHHHTQKVALQPWSAGAIQGSLQLGLRTLLLAGREAAHRLMGAFFMGLLVAPAIMDGEGGSRADQELKVKGGGSSSISLLCGIHFRKYPHWGYLFAYFKQARMPQTV